MALLLKDAHLFGREGRLDVLIAEGRIKKIAPAIAEEADRVISLNGKLVVPGFVDIHTHLDKAYTIDVLQNDSGTLDEAIVKFLAAVNHFTEEEFYRRGKQMLDKALVNGTLYLRSHITVSPEVELRAVNAAIRLKKEYSHLLDLQVIVFVGDGPDGLSDKTMNLARQAIQNGADLIGGTPNRYTDQKKFIDQIFVLAKEMDLDIDLHVDEQDKPCALALTYLAEKTAREGWQGRVTAGHCCSLSAVPQKEADAVIQKVKDSGVNVVTLPSCNLYLIGRQDRGLIRRGATRIRELLDAGVNLSLSSDNVRDLFRPFGNADILEEALITAQVAQMDTPALLDETMRMGTYNPARAMNIGSYGFAEGSPANLVVLNAQTAQQAIFDQCTREMVISRGEIIAQTTVQVTKNW